MAVKIPETSYDLGELKVPSGEFKGMKLKDLGSDTFYALKKKLDRSFTNPSEDAFIAVGEKYFANQSKPSHLSETDIFF